MKFNKTDAAKMAGISRSTLDTHIRKGKVSAIKNAKGQFEIDISELERVYVNLKPLDEQDTSRNEQLIQSNTANNVKVVQVQLDAMREQLTRERELNHELSRRLDESEEERRKKDSQIMALLTDQRPKSSGWFDKLTGRA